MMVEHKDGIDEEMGRLLKRKAVEKVTWTIGRQRNTTIQPSQSQANVNIDTLKPLLVIRTGNGNIYYNILWRVFTHQGFRGKKAVFLYHAKWSWLLLSIVLGDHASASRRCGARNHVVFPWSQVGRSPISSLRETATKKYGQDPSFPFRHLSDVF